MSEANNSFNVTRRTVIASATFVPLEAFIDRLVPKDENGPGAVECDTANYIDRSLAGALLAEKAAFLAGLAGVDALARSTHSAAFADLAPEVRDELLTSMENRPFFNRVRRLTLEGMFSDPWYGGNKNFAGWDLIRYPGPRLAVAPEDQKMSTPPKPYRKSAYG